MSERPRLKRDWVGRKVRLACTVVNRLQRVPAGTVLTVTHNYGGLTLKGEPCPHCGVAVLLSKIPAAWVDLLPKED